MVFKLARTYDDPSQGSNAQRGFPAPGAGAQRTGSDPLTMNAATAPTPVRQAKGRRSFWKPAAPSNAQRGMPEAENPDQARPAGSMPNIPATGGLPLEVYTPYFSRGAGAYVENYGKVLVNPIGAGVQVLDRPQASYGPSSEYYNGVIWWTSQAIPTSIPMSSLTSPEELAALLGAMNVQAAMRVG